MRLKLGVDNLDSRWTEIGPRGEYILCRCSCGTVREVCAKNLRTGRSKSCGCLRLETLRSKLTTHGQSRTKEYRREFAISNFDKHLLSKSKQSAKRCGVPYNLTIEDIRIPEICPVLGIPMQPSMIGRTNNTPSIDRIIPEKGYTKGNVVVVSWRANRLKNDATKQELRMLADFYNKRGTT